MKIDKNSIDEIISQIARRIRLLLEEYTELEEREKKIIEEISKLKPSKGHLEFKWVKNKIGKRYYYWYLRIKENGKLRSIYLGSRIPPTLFESMSDKEKFKRLQKELRMIRKLKRKLERELELYIAESKIL